MKNKKKIDIGLKFLNWEVIASLDSGGSGEVFIIRNDQNEEIILKKLKRTNNGRVERFDNEIDTLYQLKGNPGVIQIIDDYKKHELGISEKWYIIEKGIPLLNIIEDKIKDFNNIQSFFIKWLFERYIQLLQTLSELHDKKIYHRDIKPENIIYINDRFAFIDFGIAKNNNNEDKNLTKQYDDKGLGAKFYMAPEMRRVPLNADYSKADLYSITKTIWVTLTGENFSFDGQYNQTQDWFSKVMKRFTKFTEHFTQINLEKETIAKVSNMFYKNTSDNPKERMSISETIEVLKNWINIFYTDDGHIILSFSEKNNCRRWNFSVNNFFQNNVPNFYQWESEEINKLLFYIFEGKYFSVFLPKKNMNNFIIKVDGNDLIFSDYKGEITRYTIDYHILFYRKLEEFEYFYSILKSNNETIIIKNLHLKGEWVKYYLNGVCRYLNSNITENEEDYFNSIKELILSFKKHLMERCPYCLYQYKENNISIDFNSNIFKDL